MERTAKQAIVMRKDLGMRKGKMITFDGIRSKSIPLGDPTCAPTTCESLEWLSDDRRCSFTSTIALQERVHTYSDKSANL